MLAPRAWRLAPGVVATLAASLVAFGAGLAITYAATGGFTAFTRESARREAALAHPQAAPGLPLRFADGRVASLADLRAPWILVDFIYTRCESLCVARGSSDARLAQLLAPEVEAGTVRLLSVSFDPAHDDAARLRAFLARDGAPIAGREAAAPLAAADVGQWLDAFGVVVIADGRGGFVHNEAIAVVDPRRRLAAILNADDPARTAAWLRARIAGELAAGVAAGRNPGRAAGVAG